MRYTPLAVLCCVVACHSSKPRSPAQSSVPPVEMVPQTGTYTASSLSAPVDVVRDQEGIPHIYGANMEDISYVQGYVMAQDRWVQMDLARRYAEGKLAELLGGVDDSLVDQDIQMRMHHLEQTASDAWMQIQASADPKDKLIVSAFKRFTDGVNAYLADYRAGKVSLPSAYSFLFPPASAVDWSPVDSLAIGRLLTFQQSYSADGDIMRSAIQSSGMTEFDNSTDSARLARAGLWRDLLDYAPLDPTYTLPSGWTNSLSENGNGALDAKGELALYDADRPTILGVGLDRIKAPARGSNNWVVGPSLTKDGNAMLANDPHLSLNTPPTFWMVHLVARGGPQPTDAFGLAIPGVPGIVLGFNQHVSWGATDSYLDVCDVYQETVVACDTGNSPCVMFNGNKVPLVPRVETINVGELGQISKTISVTLYDVPEHGPIIPRIGANHTVDPLGSSELSVAYTGYAVTQEIRAIFGLYTAGSMQDGVSALAKDFTFGGFNWVLADDHGHFGWTQTIRVPRRAAGSIPWMVMPGDGTAEWTGNLDPKYIPHAYDPAAGFIATANNDPIGVTDTGDPFANAPVVNGVPLYIGMDFDPGTRVGRITKRLQAASSDHKLTLDDMQSIQADTISEVAQMLTPTLLDAAKALQGEIAKPGSHPDLTALLAAAPAGTPALVQPAIDALSAWTFDTPSGEAEDQPTPGQLVDSRATAIYNAWHGRFEQDALGDELKILNVAIDDNLVEKLLVHMSTDPSKLHAGLESNGDSILFDDLTTTAVETKQEIAAKALLDGLAFLAQRLGADPMQWRWGDLHTLTLTPQVPLPGLQIPPVGDAKYPNGFPRHGDNGTVDVGNHGFSQTDFSYSEGPQQRLVVDMTPNGPVARNTLPGGEVFDPNSPHDADLMELWRKNQTFNVAFDESAVAASADQEDSVHGDGRVRFSP